MIIAPRWRAVFGIGAYDSTIPGSARVEKRTSFLKKRSKKLLLLWFEATGGAAPK
jgi:hypothetical protein